MNIIISNSSRKPIYEQIVSQIKGMIMSEELKAGESLPSMRALAKSTRVSVITVQRAYEELTRDGFIDTIVGRGTFVSAQNKAFVQEEQLRKIEEHLQSAVDIAREHGITEDKMVELLNIFYQGDE